MSTTPSPASVPLLYLQHASYLTMLTWHIPSLISLLNDHRFQFLFKRRIAVAFNDPSSFSVSVRRMNSTHTLLSCFLPLNIAVDNNPACPNSHRPFFRIYKIQYPTFVQLLNVPIHPPPSNHLIPCDYPMPAPLPILILFATVLSPR